MGKFDLILARCYYKFFFLEREPFYAVRRKKIPRFSEYFQGGMGSPPNVGGPGGGSLGLRSIHTMLPTNEGECNRHYHAHLRNRSSMRCSVSSPDQTPRRELKIRLVAEYF